VNASPPSVMTAGSVGLRKEKHESFPAGWKWFPSIWERVGCRTVAEVGSSTNRSDDMLVQQMMNPKCSSSLQKIVWLNRSFLFCFIKRILFKILIMLINNYIWFLIYFNFIIFI
jgi:hypothetical protein